MKGESGRQDSRVGQSFVKRERERERQRPSMIRILNSESLMKDKREKERKWI